jgi:PAS domain S-box-containing protein
MRENPEDPRPAEEALRRSEARYRALAEATSQAVWFWDPATGSGQFNAQLWWEEVTGQTPEEQQGEGWFERVHPEDRERARTAWETSMTTGEPYQVEYRILDRAGGTRSVLSRAVSVRGPDGEIREWVGSLTDVTEQRREEAAHRESAERLSLAMSAANLGDWSWDAATDQVILSERAAAILGIPAGPPIDWGRLRERLHPEDREQSRLAVERAITDRGDYDIEYRVLNPEGPPQWISAKGKARYSEAGRVLGMIGVVQDITSRKRSEEKLLEADRRKDEFLAMLAHELRNPLAPIRNAVEVMRRLVPDEPRLLQIREMIDRQVAHMARLIDDLLDVSRISRGKILLRSEPVDWTALVSAAVEDHRSLLESHGLRVVTELPAGPVWVNGDPTRLSQIVGNLLQNSNKFTNQGGRVDVRLEAGRDAVLTVRDTGIGMEPEILARLFEPFSQADGSLDRSRGGLGLGLALVKGLVELHGGEVSAASPGVGQGSTFMVRLPLEPPGAVRDRAGSPGTGRALRILVVEDNRDAADSLGMMLELAGHTVEIAYTGREGLEAARSFSPEVALCDIGLPGGMDGYDLARALRQDDGLSGIHLIAISGYGQEEDQRRARAAGFDRHLTKPVDPAFLLRALETLAGANAA